MHRRNKNVAAIFPTCKSFQRPVSSLLLGLCPVAITQFGRDKDLSSSQPLNRAFPSQHKLTVAHG